jgi:alkylation response protein AidB-like acyl-CoA dehydrogenase
LTADPLRRSHVEVTLTEELAAVAELARNLGMEKLSPVARSAESGGQVDASLWGALADSGLVAPTRTEHGGDGLIDAVTHVVAAENLAYGDPGIALAALWSGAAATLLSEHGTPGQAERARRLSSDSTARGTIALYEAFGRGPDEWTTSISNRDSQVTVRGTKVAVPFAAEAEVLIVVGTDPAAGTLRAAVVPCDAAGITVEPAYGGLALGETASRTVHFDVTLPADAALGGGSPDPAALALSVERIRLLVGATAVGTAQRAIDYASAYATERIAFGRPIAGFQGVSFLLAEKEIRVEAARLEVAEAASLIDLGVADAAAIASLRLAVRNAVNYATDAAAMATRDAVQVLGGHGFLTDHPVELWYRSAAALAALDFDPLCTAFAPAV